MAEILPKLAGKLTTERDQAKLDRQLQEDIWLEDWRAYKGIYDDKTLKEIDRERSKVFIRKTKVKCDTIEARIMDILFPQSGDPNWEIGPTPEPQLDKDGMAEAMRRAVEQQRVLADCVTEVAKERAEAMRKVMADQLAEAPDHSGYRATMLEVVRSAVRLGTGVHKGPLVEQRVKAVWRPTVKTVSDASGLETVQTDWQLVHEPIELRPTSTAVNLWNFYPDMSAKDIGSCRYVWELYQMLYGEVMKLADRTSFNGKIIREYLRQNKDGDAEERRIDAELRRVGEKAATVNLDGRFDVWERWGWLRGDQLAEAGVEIPDDQVDQEFFCNVWLLGDRIIKAVRAPIKGVAMPYQLYYCEKDDASIFGEGVARILHHPQRALNGSVRAMLDNASVSAGPIIGINNTALAQNEDARKLHAFRVFLFDNPDDLKNFMVFHQVQNNIPLFQTMIKLFDEFMDEQSTPRWVHGDGNVADAAKTLGGMSMLMGALTINIAAMVKVFDDNVTSPYMTALYHWNMDFNKRADIKGDFSVVARGATALVAKEVRSQRLQLFAQMATQNPAFAPMIDNRELLKEIAASMEISKPILLSDAEVQRRQLEQLVMQSQAATAGKIKAIIAEMESRNIAPAAVLQELLGQALQGASTGDAASAGVQPETAQPALASAAAQPGNAGLQQAA